MSKVVIQGDTNGTGVFTLASPNSNTDRTLTLPDEAGTVLTSASTTVLPKGVPAFRAWLYNGGSNLSFSNNVWTKMPLDTETFDTDSFFDNTTNYRFQPTIAGYYQIVLNGYISFSTSGSTVPQIAIFKNGSEHARAGNIHSSASSYGAINLTDLVYFNGSTDYAEGYVYYNGSTNLLLRNSNYTFMSGVLVRAD
jgi:hypothetical protein